MTNFLTIHTVDDLPVIKKLKLGGLGAAKYVASLQAFPHRDVIPPEFYDYSGGKVAFGIESFRNIRTPKYPFAQIDGIDTCIMRPTHPDFSRLVDGLGESRVLSTDDLRQHSNSIRTISAATSALVLLHGWNGSGSHTWDKFPELLQEEFPDRQVMLYNYPTSLWSELGVYKRKPSPSQIAESFRTFLKNELADAEEIIVLAHSLGGIIAREYIVQEIKQGRATENRISALLLYGSPFDGTEWDGIIKWWSSHGSQVAKITADSEYLLNLQLDWSRHVAGIDWEVGQTAIMKVPTYAIVGVNDTVVSERSASFYANRIRKVIRDHQGLVKPVSENDEVFKTTLELLKWVPKDMEQRNTQI